MPGGNKRSCTLKQSYSYELQVCLSLYGFLLKPVKGLSAIPYILISHFTSVNTLLRSKVKIILLIQPSEPCQTSKKNHFAKIVDGLCCKIVSC